MKKYVKVLILILVFIVVMVAIFFLPFLTKKTFLNNISSDEIEKIEIFDGNTGNGFTITDIAEIDDIVASFQNAETHRTSFSLGKMGYKFKMTFIGEGNQEKYELYLNSSDTIRKDPYFYETDGYLCFDRIQDLENEYIKNKDTDLSTVGQDRPSADTGTGMPKTLHEMDIAPDFTTQLSGGGSFKISDHDDKIVLLNFWATWCGPCVGEMPAFEKLKAEYGSDVEIICVNCMEDTKTVDQFVKENGYTFNIGYDTDGLIEKYYPTEGIPYTLVINKGKIYKIFVGADSEDAQYGLYKEAIDSCIE